MGLTETHGLGPCVVVVQTPTLEQVEKQLEKWSEKIRKLEIDIRNKDDNKEVALGTSKINYMDPRISVAWCKRVRPANSIECSRRRAGRCIGVVLIGAWVIVWWQNEVPIERIFAKTLRDKFVWSMGVAPDWRYDHLNLELSLAPAVFKSLIDSMGGSKNMST